MNMYTYEFRQNLTTRVSIYEKKNGERYVLNQIFVLYIVYLNQFYHFVSRRKAIRGFTSPPNSATIVREIYYCVVFLFPEQCILRWPRSL